MSAFPSRCLFAPVGADSASGECPIWHFVRELRCAIFCGLSGKAKGGSSIHDLFLSSSSPHQDAMNNAVA